MGPSSHHPLFLPQIDIPKPMHMRSEANRRNLHYLAPYCVCELLDRPVEAVQRRSSKRQTKLDTLELASRAVFSFSIEHSEQDEHEIRGVGHLVVGGIGVTRMQASG
ncbi:hypothetical protein KCU61_g594, partial [Aureobasidium melanogenum]